MNSRTILRYYGVLIIGTFGNGLWELIKPLLSAIVNWVLTAATLGLSSLRDGMYEVATHSIIGTIQLQAMLQVIAAFVCVVGLVLTNYIKALSGQRNNQIDADSLEILNRSQYIEHIKSLQGRIKEHGGKCPERDFF